MRRRTFVQGLAALLHLSAAAALAVPGARFLLAPLLGKRKENPYLRVAPLSGIPIGTPVLRDAQAEKVDAYTNHGVSRIGSIWILRTDPRNAGAASARTNDASNEETDTEKTDPNDLDRIKGHIQVWQSICPHLGCGIGYSASHGHFSCPCHASYFDLTGKSLGGPSPRDMDSLPFLLIKDDASGEIWLEVRYQEFKPGVEKITPLA